MAESFHRLPSFSSFRDAWEHSHSIAVPLAAFAVLCAPKSCVCLLLPLYVCRFMRPPRVASAGSMTRAGCEVFGVDGSKLCEVWR
jgi:hypothetical protein